MRQDHFHRIIAAGLLFVPLFFAGCDPEEPVRWAPDGQHALVRGADATYVIDGTGTLVGKAPGARAWMPDSRRVLIVRAVKPRDWAEVAGLLGPERAQTIIAAAEELRPAIRDFKGAWNGFGESQPVKEWQARHTDLAGSYRGDDWVETEADGGVMAFFYLSKTYPGELAPLRAALSAATENKDQYEPAISELAIRSAISGEDHEQLLARSADDIIWCRASPRGDAVAYVIKEPLRPSLYIVGAQGGEPIHVDDGAIEASWATSGDWLVYIKTTLPFAHLNDEMLLGTLTRRRIFSDERRIMDKPDDAEDLAGLLLGKGTGFRTASLPDGGILFAGMVVKLPAVNSDMPSHVSLFTLRLGDAPSIECVVNGRAQAALPNRVDRFALSPDGDVVAIPGDTGEVAILSLKNGEVKIIQEALPEFGKSENLANHDVLTRPAPSWRNARQLCYVVSAGDPRATAGRGEVILRTLGGDDSGAISRSWPDALADRFLPRLKP